MAARTRTLGFVFKKTEIGEADLMFSIFSEDFGRIEVLAKGIRKINAKLKSQVEIFSVSEIEIVEGKFHKILVGATLKEKFKKIKKSLKKIQIAFLISQILDALLKGEEQEERIFTLLLETFSHLSKSQKEEIVFLAFFWKLISILGYKLQLDFCQKCSTKPQRIFIDFNFGGVICEKCQKNVKMAKEISPLALKILKLLEKKEIDFLERLKIDQAHLQEVFTLSFNYFNYLTEKHENNY